MDGRGGGTVCVSSFSFSGIRTHLELDFFCLRPLSFSSSLASTFLRARPWSSPTVALSSFLRRPPHSVRDPNDGEFFLLGGTLDTLLSSVVASEALEENLLSEAKDGRREDELGSSGD